MLFYEANVLFNVGELGFFKDMNQILLKPE